MEFLNTTHKKKSAVITVAILLLLLLAIFNVGMKYLDPPVEYGVAINFGNSEVGSGTPVENTAAAESSEEVVEETTQEQEASEVTEELITDDTQDEVPAVSKEVVEETVKPEEEKQKEVKKETPKPKPSKEATDALNALLNGNSTSGNTSGEGDDEEAGTKGKEKGDPDSSNYYGNSGSGSGGNYNLVGRKALTKPKQQPNCQEEGTVVVSIEVDNNGKVIKATAGVKGTTNSAPCLLEPAKQAALQTKWNADAKAPSKQRGTIIYKFSLSK